MTQESNEPHHVTHFSKDIYSKVIGPNLNGRVRGLSFGVTTKSVRVGSSLQDSISTENIELKQLLSTFMNENTKLNQVLYKMMDEQTKIKTQFREL